MNTAKGFSLVEVLIFVSILGTFFVVAIAITITSVQVMKVNEHKILATHYGEELLDWLRNEKEKDFNSFSSTRASSGGTTYCFSTSPITVWGSSGSCSTSTFLTPAIYKRKAILTSVATPPTSVNVQITVSWSDAGNNYNVPVNTVFSVIE